MANNRLYILDAESGEKFCVAKSFGDGWEWRAVPEAITQWLKLRDPNASYSNFGKNPSELRFVTENEAT